MTHFGQDHAVKIILIWLFFINVRPFQAWFSSVPKHIYTRFCDQCIYIVKRGLDRNNQAVCFVKWRHSLDIYYKLVAIRACDISCHIHWQAFLNRWIQAQLITSVFISKLALCGLWALIFKTAFYYLKYFTVYSILVLFQSRPVKSSRHRFVVQLVDPQTSDPV